MTIDEFRTSSLELSTKLSSSLSRVGKQAELDVGTAETGSEGSEFESKSRSQSFSISSSKLKLHSAGRLDKYLTMSVKIVSRLEISNESFW